MYKNLIVLTFLIFVGALEAQQYIGPEMIAVPAQRINYTVNDIVKNVSVNSFYISKYPESVRNYKTYVESIDNLDDKFAAIPNFLTFSFTNEDIEFIITEYYYEEKYLDYPIFGLDKHQIQNYLNWKLDVTGKAGLKQNGIEFDSTLSYQKILQASTEIPQRYLQVDLLLPTEQQLVAAHQYLSKTDSVYIKPQECNERTSTHPLIKKLKLKPVYCYSIDELSTYLECILLPPTNTKTVTSEIANLTCIADQSYCLDKSPKNKLNLFRVWHVKLMD